MVKSFLQYTNDPTRKLIKEALSLPSGCNGNNIAKLGWEWLGSGDFKDCYKKDNIVVKFTDADEVAKEISFYFTMNTKMRGHLARIYAYSNDRIIQAYVEDTSDIEETNWGEQIYRLQRIFGRDFNDIKSYRNTKQQNGKLIIYDFGCEASKLPKRIQFPKHIEDFRAQVNV